MFIYGVIVLSVILLATMKKVKEEFLFLFMGVLLLAIEVLFEKTLGQVFIDMLLITALVYMFDKSHRIRIEHVKNRTKSFFLALGGYIALILGGALLIPLFEKLNIFSFTNGVQITGVNSVLDVLAQTQQTLALEGYLPLTFIAFGFIVSIIETWHLGQLWESLTDNLTKIKPGFNLRTILAIFLISSWFVIYHLTAKGVDNNSALFLVFLFAIISFVLIIIEKQILSAILLHIIANTTALAVKYGLVVGFVSSLAVGIGILISLNLLTRGFKFITMEGG